MSLSRAFERTGCEKKRTPMKNDIPRRIASARRVIEATSRGTTTAAMRTLASYFANGGTGSSALSIPTDP